jgi:hypothetical protein
MPILLLGLMALILSIYALRQLGRARPAQLAANIRNGGGFLALAAAVLVLLRGRLVPALGLGGLSLFLFYGENFSWRKVHDWSQARQRARRRSRASAAFVSMTLDHATGDVDGEVVAGPYVGRKLSAMSYAECEDLYFDCLASDANSARLLETYFDRRFPGWRRAGENDANARDGGRRRRGGGDGEMSENEAYQTLGLRPGASADEIIRAHRRLMKERHPDHGGTTDEAARINQAKDKLLRRHG